MPEPTITVIIPVRDGGEAFRRCLSAINESSAPAHEVIVADDGSRDGSPQRAAEAGALVLRTGSPGSGPAAARNLAAAAASGDLLFFCDADVMIGPDTLARVQRAFADDPSLDALFGSYDDSPADPGFLSQYKNLFHHYVHQSGNEDASTFWSGCGVMRRELFLRQGGFSPRYRRPSIEDIELGCRIRREGRRIRLDKGLQVKHLKRWTVRGLLHSDIVARGIPWTRLILREGEFLNDLNLQTRNRVSVITVYAGLICLLLGFWMSLAWAAAALAAALLVVLNWPLYRFFAARRGGWFALKSLAPHWLYYFYNGLSFGVGLLLHLRERALELAAAARRESAASSPRGSVFTHFAPAAAVLLLAAYLRFHRLGAQSMWLDELLEIDLAGQSYAAIVEKVLSFGAMPLDYFVTRAALQFGAQDFWLRCAPALWSILTVAVMHRLAGRLLGRRAAIAGALLLAVGAFHVRYAQETRPYALFGLLSLMSFYFFFSALRTNRAAHWLGYGASASLSLLAHYFTLFVVGAQMLMGAIWLARFRPLSRGASRALRFAFALAGVTAALALTPYFEQVFDAGKIFAASILNPQSLAALTAARPNPDQGLLRLDRAFFEDQLLEVLSGGGAAWRWMFLGLAVAGLAALLRRSPPMAAMFAVWAVVPAALTAAFLIHRGAFFAVRYITPSYMALVALMAAAITEAASVLARRADFGEPSRAAKYERVVFAAALLIPAAFSLARIEAYYGTNKEDWRGAAQFIDSNYAPGDRVASPSGGGVIFHYTRLADQGRLDTASTGDLAGIDGRLWIVMHPYIGPASGGLADWIAAQPSAVEYRVDDSLRVIVIDQSASKARTLARIKPPDTAEAWAGLAEQYVLLDDSQNAQASFAKALALSRAPQYRAAYGDFLRQNGRGDEAAQYYFEALERDPNSTQALVGLARIYLARGSVAAALLALRRAVAANPEDYAANYFLWQASDRAGRAAEAALYRDRASQIIPDLIEPP